MSTSGDTGKINQTGRSDGKAERKHASTEEPDSIKAARIGARAAIWAAITTALISLIGVIIGLMLNTGNAATSGNQPTGGGTPAFSSAPPSPLPTTRNSKPASEPSFYAGRWTMSCVLTIHSGQRIVPDNICAFAEQLSGPVYLQYQAPNITVGPSGWLIQAYPVGQGGPVTYYNSCVQKSGTHLAQVNINGQQPGNSFCYIVPGQVMIFGIFRHPVSGNSIELELHEYLPS